MSTGFFRRRARPVPDIMKAMPSRCAVLAVLVLLSTGRAAFAQSVPPAAAWASAMAVELDAAARDAVAARDVPGAVVVVGQDGSVLYRRATGSRALVPAVEPMTIDTVFDVASLTKVVATMPAVLALWEEGRVDLDAPLGRYLKEFAGPGFREVTIRRLLTHSSGLSDLPRREAMARGFPEAAALQAKAGLASAPGSTFVYSDVGFILLAEVVRRVSGEPLDRYVQKRFYGPLGMRSTTFRPPAAWRPRIAPTEVIDGGPPLRGVVHDGNARLLSGVAGHAGLFSTADDLARFSRMLLEGGALDGHRYLKESTVRAMFTPHVIGETTRGLGWDMSSAYSRTLGILLPRGLRRPYRIHGAVDVARSGEPPVRDHHDQSRAPEREGLGGGIAPSNQRRRRPGVDGAQRAAGRRGDGRRGGARDGMADLARGDDAERARPSRGGALRPTCRSLGRARDQPYRRRCAGPPGHRPPGLREGREAPGDLLAPSTASTARSTPTCRTGATPRPVFPSGASTDRRGGRRPRCSPASTPSSSTCRTWGRATTPISPPSCTCWKRRGGGASR